MYKIAVFVTGRGSNLKAIIKAISMDMKNVKIEAVISNKKECGAIAIAKSEQIKTYFVSEKEEPEFISYNKLKNILVSEKVDLIVLAGFLKKIPENFIKVFENKIINIHPALLPSFGGKGMYGMNVHKAVFESSVQVSGVTVHFVNNDYDRGKIVAQKSISIAKVKSPEEIAELVLKEEHKILPLIVKKFSERKIKIINKRVYVE